jgi:hypothetical protein
MLFSYIVVESLYKRFIKRFIFVLYLHLLHFIQFLDCLYQKYLLVLAKFLKCKSHSKYRIKIVL